MLKLRVAHGGGDYWNLQDAIDAVPYNTAAEITVAEGVYREKIFSDKSDLTIRGEGKVELVFSDGAKEILPDGMKRGTFRSYTAFFSGERLKLENIIIRNDAGLGRDVGQAVALYLDADQAFLENVILSSDQDTLFLAPLPKQEREKNGFYGPRVFSPRKRNRTVIRNSFISGGVDFIFGGGDTLFDSCTIESTGKGYVTAPSGRKDEAGLVFYRCSFTSRLDDETVFLMRPWRPEGKSTFIECSFGKHIDHRGFSPWAGREDEGKKAFFGLCGCTADGAWRAENSTVLSPAEARTIIQSFLPG